MDDQHEGDKILHQDAVEDVIEKVLEQQSGASVNPADLARGESYDAQTDVPSGQWTNLEWAPLPGVLDTSTPTDPTVVEAGLYHLVVQLVFPTGGAAGKAAQVEIDLSDDFTIVPSFSIDPSTLYAGTSRPQVVASVCWFIPAGGILRVQVRHNAGVNLNIGNEVFLQRIA